jgi:hypothetical protein
MGNALLISLPSVIPVVFANIWAPREHIISTLNVTANLNPASVDEARQILVAYRMVRDAPTDPEGAIVTEGWRHDD